MNGVFDYKSKVMPLHFLLIIDYLHTNGEDWMFPSSSPTSQAQTTLFSLKGPQCDATYLLLYFNNKLHAFATRLVGNLERLFQQIFVSAFIAKRQCLCNLLWVECYRARITTILVLDTMEKPPGERFIRPGSKSPRT